MAQAFYPPPNCRAGDPCGGGLHELAAPKMHSQHVTMLLVSSYLTFSPFQPPTIAINHVVEQVHAEVRLRAKAKVRAVVIFFCITQPSRTASTLGSGMPCAARTFLFQPPSPRRKAASDRPSGCFQAAKVRPFFVTSKQLRNYFFMLRGWWFRISSRR